MTYLLSMAAKYLEEAANNFKVGNSNISDEQAMDILSLFANLELSKAQACTFLNISASRFGQLIKEGKIPKGRKIKGFTEKRWYKHDLIKYISSKRQA